MRLLWRCLLYLLFVLFCWCSTLYERTIQRAPEERTRVFKQSIRKIIQHQQYESYFRSSHHLRLFFNSAVCVCFISCIVFQRVCFAELHFEFCFRRCWLPHVADVPVSRCTKGCVWYCNCCVCTVNLEAHLPIQQSINNLRNHII